MKTYQSLSVPEVMAVEAAMNALRDECRKLGILLRQDHRASLAAEALAVYMRECAKETV